MTESLHQSSDFPNFDTYPSSQPEGPAANSASHNPGGPVLVQRARQIGAALGTSVSILRKARERMLELGSETTGSAVSHLNDLAETVKARAHALGEAAATRALELGESAAGRAEEIAKRAKAGYYQARRRANQISREHPQHLVVAAGAVGIVLGIGIRIWRANRAY